MLHLNRPEPPFETKAEAEAAALRAPSLPRSAIGFAIAAIVIFFAARPLASSSAAIAERLGVTTGVVGVALLALMTTLPELTVTLASVRLGAYDLAVGNMLGSNCFNMLILFLLDLADGQALLLSQAGPDLLIGASFAILLTGQATLEVLNKSERRAWILEPNAALRLVTYAFGLYFVIHAGGG
jgi:cation:H+ antiporter